MGKATVFRFQSTSVPCIAGRAERRKAVLDELDTTTALLMLITTTTTATTAATMATTATTTTTNAATATATTTAVTATTNLFPRSYDCRCLKPTIPAPPQPRMHRYRGWCIPLVEKRGAKHPMSMRSSLIRITGSGVSHLERQTSMSDLGIPRHKRFDQGRCLFMLPCWAVFAVFAVFVF